MLFVNGSHFKYSNQTMDILTDFDFTLKSHRLT